MAKQSSAKQTVVDIIEGLPEDSSYDEILQELIMNRMIERGLADVEAGRTVSDEDMAKTIESWRD
jgi:predicted transcriptional regulator